MQTGPNLQQDEYRCGDQAIRRAGGSWAGPPLVTKSLHSVFFKSSISLSSDSSSLYLQKYKSNIGWKKTQTS